MEFIDPAPAHLVGPQREEDIHLLAGQVKRIQWFLSDRLVAAADGEPHFHFALRSISRAEANGELEGTSGPTEASESGVEEETSLTWACGFGLPCAGAPQDIQIVSGLDAYAPYATKYQLFWEIPATLPPGTYQLIIFHSMEIAALSTYLFVPAAGAAGPLEVPQPVRALDGRCSAVCGNDGVAAFNPACADAPTNPLDGGFVLVSRDSVDCGQTGGSTAVTTIPCGRIECVETPLVVRGLTRWDVFVTGPNKPLIISWTGGRAGGHYHVEFLLPDCSTWVQIGYTAASSFPWHWPFGEYFDAVSALSLYRGELSTRFRIVLHENPANAAISPHPVPMFQSISSRDYRTFQLDLYHQFGGASDFTPLPHLTTPVASTLRLTGRTSVVEALFVELGASTELHDEGHVLDMGPGRSAAVRVAQTTRDSWTFCVIRETRGSLVPYRLTDEEEYIVVQNPWMAVTNGEAMPITDPNIMSLLHLTSDPQGFTYLACRRRTDFTLDPAVAPLGGKKGVWFCSAPLTEQAEDPLGFWGGDVNLWEDEEEVCVDEYVAGDLPFTNGHLTNERTAAFREVESDEASQGVNVPVVVGVSVALLVLCCAVAALGLVFLVRHRRSTRSRASRTPAALSSSSSQANLRRSRSSSRSPSKSHRR
jgi:hypothetical protein